jgi:hypothetical protein
VAFRDHLRTHPDDRDRPRYRAGKAPFIEARVV